VPPMKTEDLVTMLGDSNGWRRMLAQRLLVEGKRVDAEKALRSAVRSSPIPSGGLLFKSGPLHSLWTLHGLDLLNVEDLQAATAIAIDGGPIGTLNRDAVKLIRLEYSSNKDLQASVALQLGSPNGETRMQAILAYDWTDPAIVSKLSGIAAANIDDVWLQRAWLIAAPNLAADLAAAVVSLSRRDPATAATRTDFLRQLALNVAVRGDVEQLKRLANVVGESPESGLWWQTAIVIGLADGLPRCQNAEIPKSLAALMQTPPVMLKDSTAPISKVVQLASQTAVDKAHSDVDRIAAMGLMSHLPPEALTSALETLLTPGESTDCQRAAIDAARRSGRAELSEIVLAKWDQMNPQSRSAALDLLLLRKESILALLQKMAAGTISSSVVSIDQRLILLKHPDEGIRTTSVTLFGGTVSANRKEVADQYSKALEMKGDITRGAAIFAKSCSKCHRINNVGHNVGPDISDTRARARDALLYDVLDPNRRVDPQFTEYIVVTTDGRLFNGLMIAESADSVTLRQPEGREQTIPRSDIEDLKTTNKSLMPEGIERDVTVEQMADVLEFLKGR